MTQNVWMFEAAAVVAALGLTGLLSSLYRPILGTRILVGSIAVAGAGLLAGALAMVLLPRGVAHPVAILGLTILAAFVASIAPRSSGAGPVLASLFALLWTGIVFVPVAAWVPDIAATVAGSADGFLDHGAALGSLVAAGAAALGVFIVDRRRLRAGETGNMAAPAEAGSWGTALLACGGVVAMGMLGLASLEFAVDDYTSIIIVNTVIVVVVSVAAWLVMDRIRGIPLARWRMIAAVASGLAAASPSATLLSPLSATALGILVGICVSVALRDSGPARPASRFAFVVTAYPAALGLVLLGLVAEHRGAIFTGQPGILLAQIIAPVVAIAYSAVVSAVLWLGLRRISRKD